MKNINEDAKRIEFLEEVGAMIDATTAHIVEGLKDLPRIIHIDDRDIDITCFDVLEITDIGARTLVVYDGLTKSHSLDVYEIINGEWVLIGWTDLYAYTKAQVICRTVLQIDRSLNAQRRKYEAMEV